MEKFDLNNIFQGISTLLQSDPAIMYARIGLILLGILLVYLGRRGVLEPLEAAKKRAEELGVRVLLTGREPQRQWIRTLSALAICECAANCVRHADGTELYVHFRQKPDCMEVALTNNGAVPKEKITEGGGLSMLRQRIEEAGGKMEVWSIPRFTLMLSLPEQEEAAHESDDR